MTSPDTGVVYVTLAVFVLIILGILWKPIVALTLVGVLSIVGGILSMVLGGLFGPSVGINAIIGGIVLIALGRMVVVAEEAVSRLRGLRRDLKETRSARKTAPAPPTTPG